MLPSHFNIQFRILELTVIKIIIIEYVAELLVLKNRYRTKELTFYIMAN